MKLPKDYTERVYAGVLGKIIGVYLGILAAVLGSSLGCAFFDDIAECDHLRLLHLRQAAHVVIGNTSRTYKSDTDRQDKLSFPH